MTNPPKKPIVAAVLVGGEGKRFSQKLFAHLGGKTVLQRVLEKLARLFKKEEIFLVAKKDQALKENYPGYPVLIDEFSGYSPLFGIYTALKKAKAERVLVLGGDMPFLNPELLICLLKQPGDYEVLLLKQGELIEPLCAIYAKSDLPAIEKLLKRGELKIRAFFPEVKVAYLNLKLLTRLDPEGLCRFNLNTKEDLMRAEKLLKGKENSPKTVKAKIRKITGNQDLITIDEIINESEFKIYLNQKEIARTPALPAEPAELGAGLLFTRGLISGSFTVKVDKNKVLIFSKSRGRKKKFSAIPQTLKLSPEKLLSLMAELLNSSEFLKKTGAVHTAALADSREILFFSEDVGRHNAVDKVIGQALLKEVSPQGKILLLSGRINTEMVLKALSFGFEMIASRGAVTSGAVKLAEKWGITLAGFLRGKSLNLYTHYQRIKS